MLGSYENHGDHLPFSSDFLFPIYLVQSILDNIVNSQSNLVTGTASAGVDVDRKQFNLIVVPVVPYGVSIRHTDYPMTMSLRSSTMICLIEDFLNIWHQMESDEL